MCQSVFLGAKTRAACASFSFAPSLSVHATEITLVNAHVPVGTEG